ncbi:hypothetical protein AB0F77_12745 [Streptomyces sp. NPDC026672]|uniref:hypothetical protein n=1 Tax=unclassified Streptomyces TaxID=2593676 RepID=UPI00340E9880
MHSTHDTDRSTSGLSTEDLAQPQSQSRPEPQPRSSDPAETSADAPVHPGTPDASGPDDDEMPQLLGDEEDRAFRERWQRTQSRFVDDPREAVHDADALVADVMQTLATTFAHHKKELEGQWGQGEGVDTEELRRALRRYRSFFNRLLST